MASDGCPTPEHKYEDMIFRRCPCAFYNPEITTLIDLANTFQDFGPNSLLYMYKTTEISAKLFHGMKIVLNYFNKLKEEQFKKEQRKAEANLKKQKR